MKSLIKQTVLAGVVGIALAGQANATVPVVDIAALQQLLQQMIAWQQQLRAMQSQLSQLQQTHQALTGGRGMERLLLQTAIDRNYLPPDLAGIGSAANGAAAGYRDLSNAIHDLSATAGRLTATDIERLPSQERSLLASARQTAAENQAVTQLAYAHSSGRFGQLSTLIDKIGATPDLKAIAELQGRIAAEQAMLANEGVKLQSYGYAVNAQRVALDAKTREEIVHGHGSFAARFQPVPPAP